MEDNFFIGYPCASCAEPKARSLSRDNGRLAMYCTACDFEWFEDEQELARALTLPAIDPLAKVDGCHVEGGVAVGDYIAAHLTDIDAGVRADIAARLGKGESKYGTVLKVGWDGAWQELYQELLDGVAYAVSCHGYQSLQIARQLGSVAASVRRHMEASRRPPPGIPVVGDEIDIEIGMVRSGRRWIRARYYAPGIAIHPSQNKDYSGWAITHTHTGCTVFVGIPDEEAAEVAANMLYRADWSAPSDGEISTVVARPSVQRAYRRAADFLRRFHRMVGGEE